MAGAITRAVDAIRGALKARFIVAVFRFFKVPKGFFEGIHF